MLAMAGVVGFAEPVSTLLIFGLRGRVARRVTMFQLPVLGGVRGGLPWEGVDLCIVAEEAAVMFCS